MIRCKQRDYYANEPGKYSPGMKYISSIFAYVVVVAVDVIVDVVLGTRDPEEEEEDCPFHSHYQFNTSHRMPSAFFFFFSMILYETVQFSFEYSDSPESVDQPSLFVQK